MHSTTLPREGMLITNCFVKLISALALTSLFMRNKHNTRTRGKRGGTIFNDYFGAELQHQLNNGFCYGFNPLFFLIN